jgi:hypothetical protein
VGWNQPVQNWVLWRALASGIMLGCTKPGRQVAVLTKFYTLKVKVNSSLDQATKAQRGSRGIALLFNLGAGWEWVVNATPRSLYPRERPGTHCTGGWVSPRPGLHGRGKPRSHRDSIHGPREVLYGGV